MTQRPDRRMFSSPQAQFRDPLAALALVREIAGWPLSGEDVAEALVDDAILRARDCLCGSAPGPTSGHAGSALTKGEGA